MVISTVTTSTFLRDSTLIIRDELLSNITDPESAKRAGNEKFIMTAYPKRDVKYPIITVQNTGFSAPVAAGMQSEEHITQLTFEVRVWARNVTERDGLAQAVVNQLRNFEHDNDGTVVAGLFDFKISSGVNVDEDGEQAVKSKVMELSYTFVLGS